LLLREHDPVRQHAALLEARHHRTFRRQRDAIAPAPARIQARVTIVTSCHGATPGANTPPLSCSPWWTGAHVKRRFPPVRRKDCVCSEDDPSSAKKTTPKIGGTSSCFATSAIQARSPPSGSEPESPMKTLAGYALYQRNPMDAPHIAAPTTAISDAAATCGR